MILSRDLATAVGFLVAYWLPGLDPADFKARWPGKIVMVLQLAALFVLLLRPATAWRGSIWPIAVFSLWAIVDYTLYLARVRGRSEDAALRQLGCAGIAAAAILSRARSRRRGSPPSSRKARLDVFFASTNTVQLGGGGAWTLDRNVRLVALGGVGEHLRRGARGRSAAAWTCSGDSCSIPTG